MEAARVSGPMKCTEDHDLAVLYSIVEGVWEAAEQAPTKVPVDFLLLAGVTDKFLSTGIERANEHLSQHRRFLLIPGSALAHVCLDLGEKPQDIGYCVPSILACRSSRLSSWPGSSS